MGQIIEAQNAARSIRFGGISPVVLRELSGVYQPFVKAVKEIISNSYDADANMVRLEFLDEYASMVIEDDGCGMDPIEFVNDFIRIGKSSVKNEYTENKKRPRIGGKGIGFLAPARYCDVVEIESKKAMSSIRSVKIEGLSGSIDVRSWLPSILSDSVTFSQVSITKVTDCEGNSLRVNIDGTIIKAHDSRLTECIVWYEVDASHIKLSATINYDHLFNLDPTENLDDIGNFCTIRVSEVPSAEYDTSYTKITLHNIKGFVRNELMDAGKTKARNVESYSGIDRFLWSLSRIVPVRSQESRHLPTEVKEHIRYNIDGEHEDRPIEVSYRLNGGESVPLLRAVIEPSQPMTMEEDSDLIRLFSWNDTSEGFSASGYLIGQSTTIYPAETRGVLIRVKGVAIGESTYFGMDRILTGSNKIALTQISGEVNILSGIDAIGDINPGRDGFYEDSEQFKRIKSFLLDGTPSKPSPIKEIIAAIIARSEINASMEGFLKKHQAQRRAILETGATIAEMALSNEEIVGRFFESSTNYQLQLAPAVQFKADGKLSSYTVEISSDLGDAAEFHLDYVNKRLLLSSSADIWKRNVSIAGTNFDLIFKKGKQTGVFCEVNATAKKIYINWEHPMRSVMGDPGYIKHCMATIASALPQDLLGTYVRLITNRI